MLFFACLSPCTGDLCCPQVAGRQMHSMSFPILYRMNFTLCPTVARVNAVCTAYQFRE
jgi:hypothetical protein